MSIYKTNEWETDELETPIWKLHIYKFRKNLFHDFKIANKRLTFRYHLNRFAIKTVLRRAITRSVRRGFRFHSYCEVYGTFEDYVETEDIPKLSNI